MTLKDTLTPEEVEAISYFTNANGHLMGMAMLMVHPDFAKNLSALVLMGGNNFGWSIELFLKAYLLRHGHASAPLKGKPLMHDLELLLAEAEKLGMMKPSDDLQLTIAALAPQHRKYGFRYPRIDTDVTIDFRKAISGLQHLHDAVRPSFDPQYFFQVWPPVPKP